MFYNFCRRQQKVNRELAVSGSGHEHDVMRELLSGAAEMARSSSGLILNTFGAQEGDDLATIRHSLTHVPIFDIGPLNKLSPEASNSLMH